MTVDILWKKALEYIRSEMTEMSYNMWVNNILNPVSLDKTTLVLETPSEFYSNMLQTRYADLIKEAVKKAAGQEYEIHFVHGQKAEQRPQADRFTPMLNPKYTFDTFVIGNSNRFAHAAALAVAESPAKAYNPLFLYGGVGLGKTHLMHAIGHYILGQNPNTKILYITSEKFTNELITAIQTNKNTEFRNRYRNADVLLIDDIQFIEGKESTQEEFFHTFNALHEAEKQIIISSDRPPSEIKTLEERLLSRFEWGLIADIQKPDFETRVAILRKKAQTDNIMVDDEILQYIANGVDTNIRVLEGSLVRVMAYSTLTKQPITLPLVEEALKDFLHKNAKKEITVATIQQTVGEYYNIPVADFSAKRRTKELAMVRQIAMYLTRELTELSLPKIGEEFGGRDHTTVMHACEKVSSMISSDANFKSIIDDLTNKIKN